MRKAIYTIILNGYDSLKEPEVISPGFDYICFTDDPNLKSRTWRKIKPTGIDPTIGATKTQRLLKIMAHEALPEYDLTIYIDGSTVQVQDFNELLKDYRGGAIFKAHPKRNCVYAEIVACIRLKKDDETVLKRQMDEYMAHRVPNMLGLAETGIMIRDKSPEVIKLCEAWWNELKDRSIRDQISLPVVAHTLGIKLNMRPYHEMQKYIRVEPHLKKYVPPAPPSTNGKRIHYIQPFASDLRIGAEYNAQIADIPPDDWVCILDQDVMFLHPKTKAQIQEIVNNNTQYDLFGCMLSRIGSGSQCPGGEMSNDPNILNHYKIAEDMHRDRYGQVSERRAAIAGAFMCFPRRTWDRVKFDPESIQFDSLFSREVLKWGKIGMMEGVYLFHLYRMWADNPREYKSHLKQLNWTR